MFDEAEYLVSKVRKKNSKKKRRFSDEQIRSLEVMFESDTKLEARKKAEVARELGLQPRQIAIWFQNRRARWKSKQIEKDYSLLLSDYNALASQFESLKKDNHSLLSQLQKLKLTGGDAAEGAVAPVDDENELRKMSLVETGSSEDWEGLDSDELITQPSQGYQWWDFWG